MASVSAPVFPNYQQMPQRVPLRVWQILRIGSIAFALFVVVALLVAPDFGLALWWGFIVPVLPLIFFVAPGLWRNLCPMAALNQTPRVLGFTRGLTLPAWMKEYGYVAGIALFLAIVPTRKVIFDDNAPALALLLLIALGAAFVGGLLIKGKGGWCSSGICPLYPVQRLYGQTPYAVIPNSHCQTCVGCAKNCYDFNPRVAYIADLHDTDPHYRAYRTFFAGVMPGLIVAFYTVPVPPEISNWEMYARFALAMLASGGLFYLLDSYLRFSQQKTTALFAATAFSLYYWYNVPLFSERWEDLGFLPLSDITIAVLRIVAIALAAAWFVRTLRKERVFVSQLVDTRAPRSGGLSLAGSVALRNIKGLGKPEVTFKPEGRRVVVESGRSLLEIAEANNQKIEAGCRMGVCGADPVAILDGMDHLSPVSDEERNTLQRLGYAANTRMACVCRVRGDVTLALKPERPKAFASSVLQGFRPDPEVERVVIIGNGIAGVTAADHVRRRHLGAEIHVVAREKHHLYNRMAIERLIYGRSAMGGLYLQEDSWYDDLQITTWLNTRAVSIDRAAQAVVLGTGERLPYDRLILAMGSRSATPPIEGFGLPGSFVMREADDALAIRAYAQEHGAREALVAGGGLLGLEAAYALHKLGLHVSVLERSEWLLRRQLDQRGGQLLQEYLAGLGMEILTSAETEVIEGAGRVTKVRLKDGRMLPCDLFLLAAGIAPNVELAREAGLEVNRAVVVNDRMQTSDPHIYAAGDIAEHKGQVYGLWPTAAEQAQVAAANVVGGESLYEGSVPVTMLKVVGVDLSSVGRFEPSSPDDSVIALEEGQSYRKLVIAEGRIVGAILIGYPTLSPLVTAAIKRHAVVTTVLDRLRAGDWEVVETLPDGAAPGPPAAPTPPAPAPQPASAAPVALAAEPPTRAMETAPRPPSRGVALVLRVTAGPADGTEYELASGSAILGRSAENGIAIADDGLSRQHARITLEDGIYWLSDLGSTNGTYVNGARLTDRHPLRSGDRIRAGHTTLSVDLTDPAGGSS